MALDRPVHGPKAEHGTEAPVVTAPLPLLLIALAVLGALLLTPEVQAQSRDSGSDFTLDAANGYPTGLWSDGTNMWVADFEDRKLYAYRMSDRSRDAGKDFTLDTANGSPVGIWSDGTTMWAADFTDGKLYAYRMSDRGRDPGKDFDTLSAAGNIFPEGIWSDGTTMWVADTGNDTVFAYDLSTRAWDFEKDITLGPGHDSPMGVWSNGSTMWVSDWRDSKLYAYRMSDQTRDSGKDFALDADDESYEGICSAGATMWVASRDDVKLYAYDWNNPATGAPTITGAVRVNETLAAGARSIADADGLDAAIFEYQWVSNDGNADTDIAGATDSTYTIVPGDRGVTVRVRVSFTDGAGNRESLTSGPTGRIGAPGICDRTPAVMAAIVAGMTGAGDCSEVSETRLRAWTGSHRFGPGLTPGLHLQGRGLPALQAGDFRGLHALRALDLNRNFLETVPDGLFEDLRTVEEVHLSGNLLNELPEGTFDGQTANLSVLDLSANGLETLPEGALRNLAGLVSLSLAGNGLSHLPAGLFDDLARLEVLDLSANSIDELPDGLFDGNLELRGLDLSINEISELPEGVFAGLGNLAELDLSGNELEDLPAGVFEGLPGLTDLDAGDNPGAPFTFTAELERRGDDTVVVRIAEGATPFGMTIELSALKGELSAETVTIAAGGSYSDVVEVRPHGHHPVTVEIDSAAFLAPAGGSTPGIRAGRGSDMHLWIGRPLVQREWIQDEDFALHPENASPKSIWSDGETLWVGDDTAARVFAYKLWDDPATEASEYGTRDPGMDVPALGQEDFYVTGHGSRLYVAEESLDGASRDVFGYDLTDLTRAEDRDFVYGGLNVAGGVMIVRGMATDGRHLWITNTTSHAHAFRLFDDPETPEDEYGRPDASRKLTIPGRGQLKGLFTDGRTMWGVRFASNDASARSVKLSDGTEAGYDFPLHEDNDHAYGIWSDGETFYVVDADDAMIYTYHGVGGVVRPFVAGAETAAALVGNTGQSGDAGHDLGSAGAKRAQAFTTGTSRAGYALASVGIEFGEVSDTPSAPSDLEVTLNADGGGVPGDALCTLIAPASLSERSVNTLAAPASGTTCPALVKETTYFVVVERVRVTGSGAIAVSGTASGSEDTGAAEGWSIADGSAAYSPQAAAQGWASDAFSYRIEARGSFINNPAAGEATVTGTPRVKGTLAAAVSDVSDDDGLTRAAYSYQWMRVDGATETNIGTGSPTYTLAAEDLGKRIRVRVAFVDDRGNYETLTSEATEAIKAADRPGSVSLFPARPRAGTVVSAALTDPDGLGGGGSGPAASSGAVSWSWARSSDGTAWTGVEAYDDGDSYVPTEEDEGMLLRAEASYTDGQGPGKSAEAVSPAVVGAREPGPELTVTEIVSGLSHPWGIDFTPDGTMLFTQRAGVLNARLTDGAVRRVAADLGDLLVDGFAGLQALAVDPDFTTNRRFYTLQGHAGREMRVIAWTIDADYDEATRVVDPLVKGMPIGPGPWHSGGRLLFGPEGYLWIATGDGRVVTGAQDLTSLGGKVLRVDPRTGAGAPGNPFGASSPVYAYGFRNPQGLALRPGTDQMWLVEHGPKHDDEINLLAPGGNYGWDPIPDDGALVFYDYSDEAGVPMTDLAKFPSARQARWSSGFPTLATSGAVFLDGPQWGEWEGRLAVATLKTKSLRVFQFTEQGDFAGQIVVPELDGSQGRLRTPALGPDGALYIATSNRPGNDRILRVSANRAATGAPVISGGVEVGESLTAVVSGIADPDGLDDDAFRFQWVRSHFGSNSSDIEGATASTYTLVTADFGKTISVRVSFYDDRGSLEALTSRRTVKVSVVACTVGEHAPAATAVEVQAIPAIVESTTEEYFALYVRPALDSDREFPVSVTLGEDGATTLTEQLSPLPKEHYRVEKFLIADPADLDNDCIDDITELGDPVGMNPLNPARAVPFRNGAVAIPGRETFEALSYKGRDVPYHPRLQDLEFVKFYIIGVATDNMGIYFMNTETHRLHPDFGDAIGLWEDPLWGQGYMGGEIIYHPNVVAPDGSLGVYRYQFQPMDVYPFDDVARSYEVLAASMPLLDDNLAYYPMPGRALPLYHRERALYDDSRINVVLREDILPDVPFLPLNVGEGYGFLRLMSLEERPDPRDVVIYETIPNELSRVAGLITTVPQTPLSHVNLRAVQDGVPNAFIRDALDDGDIDDLIGRYVHYSVTAEGYSIRAATPAEVEAYFAASRPPGTQTPERDLTVTRITDLDDIGFDDWNAFGVKAANVAVLQTLDFPEGTVPDGFGVPFYFYDEFMKHNGFYDDIETMLADAEFQSDPETQDEELKALRKKIKKGSTPQWIIDGLTAMHSTYPDGQSLRYRSSTNNEDLPGFSGAGLYDSKTQDPEETVEAGIDKSIKAVYGSLWNFRAFTERESHGVDHLATAMGVLVHPNYSEELANGVAVSFDPNHHTYGSYYVNTQLGEALVTNPEAHSVPEEILLHRDGTHSVLATSNQVTTGQLLMSDAQMDQLRSSLRVIHEKFEDLYAVESNEPFAIEIEFKITSDNILAIKQARPWVFGENASRPNSPATGIPTIEGTPHVNQTLTADTSGIADADGLTNPTFTYQWTRTDGTTDTDITGETSSTHTVTEEDAGNHLKVSVTFTDDLENIESLTSTTTKAVVDYDTDEDRLIEITTLQQLHAVRHDLDGNGIPADDGMASYAEAFPASADQMGCPGTEGCMGYELMADLDFDTNGSADADSADAYWNDGAGWTPIGGDGSRTSYDLDTMVDPFLAIFEGNGHSLSNLFIDRLNPFTGMFGYIGSDSESGAVAVIRNLNLVDINVTGNHYTGGLVAVSRGVITHTQVDGLVGGGDFVGGLVGQNYGVIADSHLTGCVSGDGMVGGVVGRSYGAITNSSLTGCVSGTDYVGGLAGNNYGPISASHTEGQVSGNTVVGGLVGSHKGTITASRSSARVLATGSAPVPQITGGLVGDNRGAITVSYATGDVSGKGWVGGLVGQSHSGWESNSAITASYATGRVSGTTKVGGLVGTNGGAIAASYARGEVSGNDKVGGMSGSNDGTITASYWDTTVSGQSSGNNGEGKTTEELQTPTGYSDIYEPWNLESNDIAGSPLDLGSATQHLALAAGLDTDSDHVLDYPWDLGSSSQYPALAADLNGDGRATWQEFGHQLRAVPVLNATVPTGQEGFELTWTPVDTSHWSPVPRLTYTLYRDDGDTVEAIAEQLEGLKHTDNDVTSGEAYAYQVVASIAGGETAPSAWVSATLETNSPATGAPTISGTAQSGATLTADTSGIADADGLTEVSYRYQWIAGESDISGATNSSYTLTSNEEGQTIQVRVSFPDDAGNPETLTSIATDTVGPQYDDAEEAPMWSADMLVVEYTGVSIGAATADLFSNIGGSGGLQVRSLWSYTLGRDLRLAFTDGVPGAAEYTLQVGHLALAFPAGSSGQSSFKWTDVDVDWEDGHTIPVSIVATSTLAEPTPNTPATGEPTISGTPQVGVTLTADVSGITDADGLTNVSYRYQWIRKDGTNDADIGGQTGSTYTLTDEDVGKSIKVRVSFTDDADNAETRTSEATDTVAATKPGIPGRLNVFPHDAGALDVYWEAPASDGGSDITGYKVRWKESADSWDTAADVSEATASGTIHTITGLTDGVEYSVRVLATNGEGDSPPSVEQTGTPRETKAPEMVRPRVDGATLNVLYDEALDEGSAPPTDSFDVRVVCRCDDTKWQDEKARRVVDAVSVNGETVVLTLASAATSEDVVVVSYTPPSDAATARTRDLAGNAAAGFNATEVFNDTDETAESEKSGEQEETTEAETPLTVSLEAATESHNGTDAFTFEIRFSEEVELSYVTLRDQNAFSVTDGEVTGVSRLDKPGNLRWEIVVEPDSGADVTIVLPPTTDCGAQGAICTEGGKKLSGGMELTVNGPEQQSQERQNNSATGAPTISGTPQVGETLTASTSGIADQDGLTNVSYRYQWTAGGADISGATGASHTLTAAEEGQTIQVRVDFTDDAGNDETLTSAATVAVAPKPVPLTASFQSKPSTHDGQTAFTFELRFSEEVELSYVTLRDDDAFSVTDGEVTSARRLTQGSNIGWTITVTPGSAAGVTVVLPVTTDCDDTGAICTQGGRKLSNRNEFTVSGPGG